MTKIDNKERKNFERKILRGFIFANQRFPKISRGFNFANLGEIREIRENFSSQKFVSLRYSKEAKKDDI